MCVCVCVERKRRFSAKRNRSKRIKSKTDSDMARNERERKMDSSIALLHFLSLSLSYLDYSISTMSWYHASILAADRRPSRLIASCKRFSRRLSSGIFRAVRRIQIPGRSSFHVFFPIVPSLAFEAI